MALTFFLEIKLKQMKDYEFELKEQIRLLEDNLNAARIEAEALVDAAKFWTDKYESLVARITTIQRTDTITLDTVRNNPWQVEHVNYQGVTELFKMIRDSDDYILTERTENEDGSITISHKLKVLKLKGK